MTAEAHSTLDSLLAIVERDRDERLRAVARQAEAQARAIVQKARKEAREQTAEVVSELRSRRAMRIEDARAALATQVRRRQQAASRVLLDRAWEALPDALRTHWHEDAARQRWLGALLALAVDVLPRGSWRIEHPVDWDEAERQRFSGEVMRRSDSQPVLVAEPSIEAGVCITIDAACLDGSTAGLCADRSVVAGRLLVEVLREAEEEERS